MRRIIVIFLLLLFAGGMYFFLTRHDKAVEDSSILRDVASENTRGEQADVSTGVRPAQLVIPKLHLTAAVEYVGMDEKGNMDVPKRDENVAWFEPGYLPGTNGNAVIAGHLDTKTGAPAVFYTLETLVPGDTIQVIGTDGKTLSFTVTDRKTYPADAFPLTTVFGATDTPQLNLITCEGSFNSTERNYSHRTVVYSTLKK